MPEVKKVEDKHDIAFHNLKTKFDVLKDEYDALYKNFQEVLANRDDISKLNKEINEMKVK